MARTGCGVRDISAGAITMFVALFIADSLKLANGIPQYDKSLGNPWLLSGHSARS
ncbi:hypothetical protein [Sphingobium chungbukense]|uniref:hypothetical protein n=1 Tax=Sphingobium chungbukense TaxID=56193 RepID=UPI001E5A07E9|nr:hypothetical protein [Sphingobium chungbukense]